MLLMLTQNFYQIVDTCLVHVKRSLTPDEVEWQNELSHTPLLCVQGGRVQGLSWLLCRRAMALLTKCYWQFAALSCTLEHQISVPVCQTNVAERMVI